MQKNNTGGEKRGLEYVPTQPIIERSIEVSKHNYTLNRIFEEYVISANLIFVKSLVRLLTIFYWCVFK